jgi:undecaprenyl-diphosphatase
MQLLIIFSAKYLIVVSIALFIFGYWKLGSKDRRIFLLASLAALPSAYIIAKILGHLFYNPRPFVGDHIQPLIKHAADNGFPSDHTLITMALAAIVYHFNKRLGIIMGCISLIIGFARVAAHVHHTIDILGAACIGLFIPWICFKLMKKTRVVTHRNEAV